MNIEKDTEFPLVSIVIPVYNGADYLGNAIDSALAQDYKNIEVIVVNDGSNDNGATESAALSYGEKIRYFYKENGGVSTALNFGISKMKGKYFSWLSHDDWYYKDKISTQFNALKTNNNFDSIVFSAYDIYDMKSDKLTHFLPHSSFRKTKLENSVFSLLEGFVHFCTMLVPRECIIECGGFDENLKSTQDDEMCFRMFRKYRIIYEEKAACVVRMHDNQGSKTIPKINEEKEKTWYSFLDILTDEEKVEMYGSLKGFYHAMRCFFFSAGMKMAYEKATSFFATVQDEKNGEKNKLKKFLKNKFNKDFSKVCIFGAGRYGIRTAIDLLSKNVKVTSFCDSNEKIYNTEIINGIFCESYENLKNKKDETLVIIALKQQDEVFSRLQNDQFPYLILRDEIREISNETEITDIWRNI